MEFSLIFYYGGRFDRDCLVYYTRRNEHVVATCIVIELTELRHSEYWLWWYNSDANKYNRMVSYNDVDKVYQYAMVMKCAIHIYVEHKGKFKDTKDNEDSNFEAGDLSFDDSEDEMTLRLDDCFDVIENQVEEKGKRGRIKVAAKKHKHTPKKVSIGVDNVGSSSSMDNEMVINYASDKIGSSDPDASDGEKEPKYPRHAIAALGFKRQFLEDFVDDYYSKDTYEKCHGYNVSPINGQDIWPKVGMEEMLSPSYKRGPGPPKKPRRREPDEDHNKFEMLAANLTTTFEAIQTQLNLAVNRPIASVPSQPNHNTPITATQGEPVTSSQTDDVPDYIFSAPVPTTDDVHAAPISTTTRVLKLVEFNIPFHNDLELFC
ncbi:hypothetical protein KIW84_052534 [Lathyrus oleraceus]|uniref:Uncharacterized protein n=1 Tax=Pisum sativum TaxID=3888 RepID=A0A9D4WSB8_PEA|nr:hypothetical protein KIW84_052534 [Pisum sativum]